MKALLTFCIILSMMPLTAQQILDQTLERFTAETFSFEGKEFPYRVLYPKDFDASKSYPLHLFLHGAGERGSDNKAQLTHGSELFIKMSEQYPAIVIFPQCPKDDYWADVIIDRSETQNVFTFPKKPQPTWAMRAVLSLLDSTISNSYVDTSKIYVGGLSMGGMGTFELLHLRPNTFAAATAICGGGYPANVSNWATSTPAWIFHGEVDPVVPVIYSQLMVEALLQEGATPRISLYPGVQHDSWTPAFAEPDLFSWIYAQSKKEEKDALPATNIEAPTPARLQFSEAALLHTYKDANALLSSTIDPNRTVFMGDSITESWLSSSPTFWADHSNFVNRGVSGQTTSQMLLRFRKDVIDLKPKRVVILAGTNDIAGNTGKTSINTIFENIVTMSELATYHDIEVVISSILPVYEYPWNTEITPAQQIIRLNQELKNYAQKQGFTYIDYHLIMKDASDGMQALLSYDGVHCNQAGYEVMEGILTNTLALK